MKEEEKIFAGQFFCPGHPDLKAIKLRCHNLCSAYNATLEDETEKRNAIVHQIFGDFGEGSFVQGPIQIHYGTHTHIGKSFFGNFNLTIQDDAPVTIGDRCNFGPNVTIVTPVHPMLPDERQQMRDFIVNSVKYWAKEYHIDGFRFDLMAIHDTETMNQVAAELKKINPSIFVYGEGWTAGDSPLPVERRALKENVDKMKGIAVFSDDIRDAVKGHYSNAADRGFATGKPGNEETVKIGIVASTAHPQVDYSKGNNSKFPYAGAPTQIINYVSCHDDLTLTDKLAKSMPGSTEAERQRAARLAQTIVFTSQGTPFMFAGEEIFRDKKGVHNSYKSPDSINAIDWSLKHKNAEQFDYYRELIALRKAHPAFRMTTAEEIAKNIVFDKVDAPNVVSYSIRNNANGDEWKEIKLVFNGSADPFVAKVPKGDWIVVARDGSLRSEGMGSSKGGNVVVPPTSALILARK